MASISTYSTRQKKVSIRYIQNTFRMNFCYLYTCIHVCTCRDFINTQTCVKLENKHKHMHAVKSSFLYCIHVQYVCRCKHESLRPSYMQVRTYIRVHYLHVHAKLYLALAYQKHEISCTNRTSGKPCLWKWLAGAPYGPT